jgi:hypothetical protein
VYTFVRESWAPMANENDTRWLSRACRASTCATWKARWLWRCCSMWCTVAPSASSISVTGFAKYAASPSPTWLSMTVTFEWRSATITVRGCEAPRAPAASVT